jgi:myo-inositol 2-dehydrogenase/D-chiro-inositol 1-dehydrogenase
MKNGKICEKPVALDLARTQRALDAVAKKGVAFQIGFQRRFDSGYAEAKRRIEAGALGRLDQFRTVGRDPAPHPGSTSPRAADCFLTKPFMNLTSPDF